MIEDSGFSMTWKVTKNQFIVESHSTSDVDKTFLSWDPLLNFFVSFEKWKKKSSCIVGIEFFRESFSRELQILWMFFIFHEGTKKKSNSNDYWQIFFLFSDCEIMKNKRIFQLLHGKQQWQENRCENMKKLNFLAS